MMVDLEYDTMPAKDLEIGNQEEFDLFCQSRLSPQFCILIVGKATTFRQERELRSNIWDCRTNLFGDVRTDLLSRIL
jgi:hypothetical protein